MLRSNIGQRPHIYIYIHIYHTHRYADFSSPRMGDYDLQQLRPCLEVIALMRLEVF